MFVEIFCNTYIFKKKTIFVFESCMDENTVVLHTGVSDGKKYTLLPLQLLHCYDCGKTHDYYGNDSKGDPIMLKICNSCGLCHAILCAQCAMCHTHRFPGVFVGPDWLSHS